VPGCAATSPRWPTNRSDHLRTRQHLDAVDHRRHRDIGQRERAAGDPGAAGQLLFHPIEKAVELGVGLVLLIDRHPDLEPALQPQRDHGIGAFHRRRHLFLVGAALVHTLGVPQVVRADVDVPVRQLRGIVDP